MSGHTPWSEIRHKPTPIGTYILTINAPRKPEPYSAPGLAVHMDRFMRETEENLTDLLPEGWSVEIHEWDEPFDDEVPHLELRERIRTYGEE